MVFILDDTLSVIITHLYSDSILEVKPEEFLIFGGKTKHFFHCIYRDQSKSGWLTYFAVYISKILSDSKEE